MMSEKIVRVLKSRAWFTISILHRILFQLIASTVRGPGVEFLVHKLVLKIEDFRFQNNHLSALKQSIAVSLHFKYVKFSKIGFQGHKIFSEIQSLSFVGDEVLGVAVKIRAVKTIRILEHYRNNKTNKTLYGKFATTNFF